MERGDLGLGLGTRGLLLVKLSLLGRRIGCTGRDFQSQYRPQQVTEPMLYSRFRLRLDS